MSASFFFYDLETSGLDARLARVMQFAGQRTDMDLNPIGEPVNVMVKLAPDVLPSPDAVMITGITPQQTLVDGLTEAEFLQLFYEQVVQPDTIFVGFNTVRFDDEFMRFMHWRNFYDPYEWAWKDNCSRWDILDVVRMTRALRPEGIQWPFTDVGKPTNRLELLTQLNGLSHEHAHDALNDVLATIAVAKLIRDKQPDLFKYLLEARSKKVAAKLVEAGEPFVYTSGKYPIEILHTTAAVLLAKHPQPGCGLVYDLRHDPTPFIKMTVEQLVEAWRYTKEPGAVRLPVKTVKYNRCPAVAPMGVIKTESAQQEIDLPFETITKNFSIFKANQTTLATKVLSALQQLDSERELQSEVSPTADTRLYEKFISDHDKSVSRAIRTAKPADLGQLARDLHDDRLQLMLPLYKARNFPKQLSDEERQAWEEHCRLQLFDGETKSQLAQYFARLQEISETKLTDEQEYLLEELQLYGQSIVPVDVAD
jgi:exodeoxyribonuclease-1